MATPRMKTASRQVQVILVTVANQKEAVKIANAMVSTNLAACANIVPAMQSIYRWKGKIVKEREALIILKSTKAQYPALEQAIKELHSYETPEIIALSVSAGLSRYLAWVADTTHS
ncbi:MAG: Divalent-cation tolerance protein CutA [Nitrospira sp.]|nr:Divalent-cation tolerance protein CutA [Nitrospira sp.]